jgi:hypothetical protein
MGDQRMTTASKRFQFTTLDLLTFTVLAAVGVGIFLANMRPFESPPFLDATAANKARLVRGLWVICFSSLAGLVGVWIANEIGLERFKRAIPFIILLPMAWLLFCFFLPANPYVTRRGATSSAAALKAFAEAQEIYHRTDYDGDGILEYSPSIRGNFSLIEKNAGQADLCLLDKTFGVAEGSPGKVTPKGGYVFKVLHAQGPLAKGGAKSYFKADANGVLQLTEGYALIASPGWYDVTGRDTYMINQDGVIYQRDLGPDTPQIFDAMTEFNPDSTWAPSE